MNSIELGPVIVPLSLPILLAAAGLGVATGRRVGRGVGADLEARLFHTLLVSLLAARLVFVWRYRAAYFASPWDILDLRDGGWAPIGGVVAGWLYALSLGARLPLLMRPLVAALAVASVTWTLGMLALALWLPSRPPLPALALSNLAGGSTTLTDFKGKPTVVNLWASWCPPCREEMPVLSRAQDGTGEVNFVFVDQGETAERIHAFMASQHLPLRNVLLDARGEVATGFGYHMLPTTMFFDARGRLIDVRQGPLTAATLAQRLGELSSANGNQAAQ